MVENIVISEGGVGRKFHPVSKLQINNQDESQSLWVAEETLNTGSINVTSNGVYSAVEDELFAYDEVTVDVAEDITDPSDTNSVTGKDSDGNDYEYSLGEDGNLDVSMIPAAIHIVVKPRKLKYRDGETIDFSGIHVYLMDGNSKRYTDSQYPTGEIPFDELMFPVTVATTSEGGTYIATLPDDSPILNIATPPFPLLGGDEIRISGAYDWVSLIVTTIPTVIALFKNSSNNVFTIHASSSEFSYGATAYKSYAENIPTKGDVDITYNALSFTMDGKTVYFGGRSVNGEGDEHPYTPIQDNLANCAGLIAWYMIYGDIRSTDDDIPVQWMRSDGEILEDTFEIEIGEGGEPGPPEPDPWSGDYDVSWNGHTYNINRRIVPEVHYANGYCWQEGTTEYTVEQAVGFGWLIRVGM